MKQFKLTLSFASSCGGNTGDSLGHVLILSKQKQIFLGVSSILAGTRSVCSALGKIDKFCVLFPVEMIPYLDGPSGV